MIHPNFAIGVIFLIALSLLDFATFNKKKGAIPSVATTLFLILAFILALDKPGLMIEMGLFGSLLALLFTDLDLWGGVADLKTFIACSMLMPSFAQLLIFGLLLTIGAVMLKGFVKWQVTKGKEWDIPFIPIILIAFAIAGVLG